MISIIFPLIIYFVYFVCESDLSSSRYVHSPYFGRYLDDDEATDDVKSNTTDEEMDLVSYNLQALTKARFVKILILMKYCCC